MRRNGRGGVLDPNRTSPGGFNQLGGSAQSTPTSKGRVPPGGASSITFGDGGDEGLARGGMQWGEPRCGAGIPQAAIGGMQQMTIGGMQQMSIGTPQPPLPPPPPQLQFPPSPHLAQPAHHHPFASPQQPPPQQQQQQQQQQQHYGQQRYDHNRVTPQRAQVLHASGQPVARHADGSPLRPRSGGRCASGSDPTACPGLLHLLMACRGLYRGLPWACTRRARTHTHMGWNLEGS